MLPELKPRQLPFTLVSKKVLDLTKQNHNRPLYKLEATFRYYEPFPTLSERLGFDDEPGLSSYSGWVEDSKGRGLPPGVGDARAAFMQTNRTNLLFWDQLPDDQHHIAMTFDLSDVPASAGRLRLTILMMSKDGDFRISAGAPNPKQQAASGAKPSTSRHAPQAAVKFH